MGRTNDAETGPSITEQKGPPVEESRPRSQFLKLSPTLYEYVHPVNHPNLAESSTGVPPPDLGAKAAPSTIVLFGWAGAPLHTIGRFAKGHSKLFPTARILAVLSTPTTLFFQTDEAAKQTMMPLVKELSSQSTKSPSDSVKPSGQTSKLRDDIAHIILHVFSNGGLISTRALSLAWRESFSTSLPHSLLILDSCPGSGSFNTEVFRWASSACAPFLTRNSVASKVPGGRIFLNIVAVGWVTAAVRLPEIATGRQNLVSAARNCVHDLQLLDQGASMLYIYSTGDQAVRWQDVEASIEDVKKADGDRSVASVKLEKSNHVAHETAYRELYWRAVGKAWEERISRNSIRQTESKL